MIRAAVTVLAAYLSVGCSRTGLPFEEAVPFVDGGGMVSSPFTETDGAALTVPSPGVTECSPTEETCNGRDDDCNGEVDEVTPVPCPGGGDRYCIGGRMSECPERCEACLPGTIRICFTSYCTFWGEQTCAADGRAFGACVEEQVPRECREISAEHQRSPELEQCCIDNGYCCMDDFDLDGDGNRSELLGRCDEVLCQ